MIPMATTTARLTVSRTACCEPAPPTAAWRVPNGPPRRIAVPLLAAMALTLASTLAAQGPTEIAASTTSTADVATDQDWRFPRGDAEATGARAAAVPEKLKVAWEFEADEAIET